MKVCGWRWVWFCCLGGLLWCVRAESAGLSQSEFKRVWDVGLCFFSSFLKILSHFFSPLSLFLSFLFPLSFSCSLSGAPPHSHTLMLSIPQWLVGSKFGNGVRLILFFQYLVSFLGASLEGAVVQCLGVLLADGPGE